MRLGTGRAIYHFIIVVISVAPGLLAAAKKKAHGCEIKDIEFRSIEKTSKQEVTGWL